MAQDPQEILKQTVFKSDFQLSMGKNDLNSISTPPLLNIDGETLFNHTANLIKEKAPQLKNEQVAAIANKKVFENNIPNGYESFPNKAKNEIIDFISPLFNSSGSTPSILPGGPEGKKDIIGRGIEFAKSQFEKSQKALSTPIPGSEKIAGGGISFDPTGILSADIEEGMAALDTLEKNPKTIAEFGKSVVSRIKKIMSFTSPKMPSMVMNDAIPGVEFNPKGIAELKGMGKDARNWWVGNRNGRITQSNIVANEIEKILPEKIDQEALTFYRELKNNPDAQKIAKSLIDSSDPRIAPYQEAVTRALAKNLKSVYGEADSALEEYFTHRGKEGKLMGYVSAEHNDYITHLIHQEDLSPFDNIVPRSSVSRRTPFGQGRYYSTAIEAINDGQKLAHTNASDLVRIYGERDAVANSTTQLLEALKSGNAGSWFKPREIPKDWVNLDQYGTRFRTPFRSFATPKPFADMLKPILAPKNIPGGLQKFRWIQGWAKYVNLGLSVFHAKALSLVAQSSMGEKALYRAWVSDLSSPEMVEVALDFAFHTGTTSKLGDTLEAYRRLKFGEEVSGEEVNVGKIKQIPVVGKLLGSIMDNPLTRLFDKAAQKTSGLTFDYLQTRYKLIDYSKRVATWMAKNPNASEESLAAGKRDIAKFVNNLYGGLNWEALGVSKNVQEYLRTFMLAPDWTISNFAPFFQGIFKGDKYALKESLKFLTKSVVRGIAMTQFTNIVLNGRPSKEPWNVTMGIDNKGKEIKANMFFSGNLKDVVNLLVAMEEKGLSFGAVKFASGKAAPFVKELIPLATGKDYFGQDIVPQDLSWQERLLKEAGFLSGDILPKPIALSSPIQDAIINKGSVVPSEILLAGMGFGYISHQHNSAQMERNFYSRLDRLTKLPKDQRTQSDVDFLQKAAKYRTMIKQFRTARENIAAMDIPWAEKYYKIVKASEGLNLLLGEILK